MSFVAFYHLLEHLPNLVRGNIITLRLVAYLLLYYYVFMLTYCMKYLFWIVDYQNKYSWSTFVIYSRFAASIEDISTVPVDAL